MKNSAYVHNVDELIAETPLDSVLIHYGLPPTQTRSGEYRMKCVFNESCDSSSYGQLAVATSHPAKQIFCHVCGTRGNLLTLIHGLATHQPPATGKLRGQEFKDALRLLKEISGIGDATRSQVAETITAPTAKPATKMIEAPKTEQKRNVPLHRHENEGARKIADLHKDLVTDVAEMSPASAAYVRSRPWMTPEIMEKWKCGYLPRDGRSMFRGLFVYTHLNAAGEPVSYSARDPLFEDKHKAWLRDGESKKRKPIKHRYVKGYARGAELFGQHASRLEEPSLQQSLRENGLVCVEGANDTIALDALGIAAVGLNSNRATDQQIDKLERIARQTSKGRITLLPDNDEEGEAGFQELLWSLSDRQLDVRLGWSRIRGNGKYDGLQPECITSETWQEIAANLLIKTR